MLFVDRKRVELADSIVKILNREAKLAENFFQRRDRSQQRFSFNQAALDRTRGTLDELFWGTCAFCESETADLIVSRFRPKIEAINTDNTADADHYWWLAFQWENLYLICGVCERNKGNRFPVEGKRTRIKGIGNELAREARLLLDPCRDNPARHLHFLDNGTVTGISLMVGGTRDLGGTTIDVFALNRPDLVRARANANSGIRKATERIESILGGFRPSKATVEGPKSLGTHLASLIADLDERGPYIASKRQFAARWLINRPEIRGHIDQFESAAAETLWNLLETELEVLESVIRNARKSANLFDFSGPQAIVDVLEQSIVRYLAKQTGKAEIASDSQLTVENAYLRRLEIHNFRAIRNLALEFNESSEFTANSDTLIQKVSSYLAKTDSPPPVESAQRKVGWKMLVGENGSGKSSILKALALALMGEDFYRKNAADFALEPARIFNNKTREKSGYIKVELSKGESIQIEFSRDKLEFGSGRNGGANMYFRGYGAARLYSRRTMEGNAVHRLIKNVDNLFHPEFQLVNPNRFLAEISKTSFDSIALSLRDLLNIPLSIKRPLTKRSGGVLLNVGSGPLPFSEQSDGYSSVLALLVDIFAGLPQTMRDKREASGIVILDEIDAHLHPRWKMTIVESLRRTFPGIQFICTTHEPLCLRQLAKGEIAVLKRQEGVTSVFDNLPATTGLRVDQLLTSEIFGLESAIDPEVDLKFHLYYRLLAEPIPENAARAKIRNELIEQMKTELNGHNVLGFTRRDQLVYEFIDEYLAERRARPESAASTGLREVTKRKVFEIWDMVKRRRQTRR